MRRLTERGTLVVVSGGNDSEFRHAAYLDPREVDRRPDSYGKIDRKRLATEHEKLFAESTS